MAVLFSAASDDALPSPYPGLRTFNEDESIYFRGRETHVGKCVALLAEHRFLMVTGASGDGKSSLVFAGMVPEIRAGFFRAKYAGWAVASFRPERAPLANLAAALADALLLPGGPDSAQSELEHGFSALVELYQNSPRALPADADPADRTQRRAAANLLIIVDQFEEFFTNPENLNGDTPVPAAQTVVNLLLETARLARDHNLPLYIVCTMRSDYVGQCVAFAGLAEALGDSHYFVPRLTREELKQVIREPASLSGCEISERLTERLLYDLHDGQDQLPVLQHALYQIWNAADRGEQKLDLLHYAQVGGLAPDELPRADLPAFARWFAALPASCQAFYQRPSLGAVLDTHAETLFAQATADAGHFSVLQAGGASQQSPAASDLHGPRIVEAAFRALTNTDGGRVVRNRVTGADVVALLNDPTITWPLVDAVLRRYRLPGNTFVQPFVTEEESGEVRQPAPLPETAVLDITHESLIRNWRRLTHWAAQEAQDVATWRDLAAQAQRWEANGRRAGFLLPIGSYTYFSEWAARFQPTTAWLARYDGAGETASAGLLATAQQFLKRSKRSLAGSLFWVKYGTRRNTLRVAGVLAIVTAVFGWQAWHKRQDNVVARNYLTRGIELLQSKHVPVSGKAGFIIIADRLTRFDAQGYQINGVSCEAINLLNTIPVDTQQLDVAYQTVFDLANDHRPDRRGPNPLVSKLIEWQRARLLKLLPVAEANYAKDSASFAYYEALVQRSYALANLCAYRLSWHEDSVARRALRLSLNFLDRYVKGSLLSNRALPKLPRPLLLLGSVRMLITFDRYQAEDCRRLVAALSPFSALGQPPTTQRTAGIAETQIIFTKQAITLARGLQMSNSGLYWLLSFAAARQGDVTLVARCLDSLQRQGDIVSQLKSYECQDGGVVSQLLPVLARSGRLTVHAYKEVAKRIAPYEVSSNFQEPVVTLLAYPTLLRGLSTYAIQSNASLTDWYYEPGPLGDHTLLANLPACFLKITERSKLWTVADSVRNDLLIRDGPATGWAPMPNRLMAWHSSGVWRLLTHQGPAASADRQAHAMLTYALLLKFAGLYAVKFGAPAWRAEQAFKECLHVCADFFERQELPKTRTMFQRDATEQVGMTETVLGNHLMLLDDRSCPNAPLESFTASFANYPEFFPTNSRMWKLAGEEVERYLVRDVGKRSGLHIGLWTGGKNDALVEFMVSKVVPSTGILDTGTIHQLVARYPVDSTRGWLLRTFYQLQGADSAQATRVLTAFRRSAPRYRLHPADVRYPIELALYDELNQQWANLGITPVDSLRPQMAPPSETTMRLNVAKIMAYEPEWARTIGPGWLKPVYTLYEQKPELFRPDLSTVSFFVRPNDAVAISSRILQEGKQFDVSDKIIAFSQLRGIGFTQGLYAASRQQPVLLRAIDEMGFINGLLHTALYRRLISTHLTAIERNQPAGWEDWGITRSYFGVRS